MLETANKAAAAFGISVRFPFADRRLMAFCLALPPTQQYHRGWTRVIARRAMEGCLPEEVRLRFDKSNLTPAFHRSLFLLDRVRLDALVPQKIDD